MLGWVIKSKKGYLMHTDSEAYGVLLKACLFKTKKETKQTIEEAKNYVEYLENAVRIEIKEI